MWNHSHSTVPLEYPIRGVISWLPPLGHLFFSSYSSWPKWTYQLDSPLLVPLWYLMDGNNMYLSTYLGKWFSRPPFFAVGAFHLMVGRGRRRMRDVIILCWCLSSSGLYISSSLATIENMSVQVFLESSPYATSSGVTRIHLSSINRACSSSYSLRFGPASAFCLSTRGGCAWACVVVVVVVDDIINWMAKWYDLLELLLSIVMNSRRDLVPYWVWRVITPVLNLYPFSPSALSTSLIDLELFTSTE